MEDREYLNFIQRVRQFLGIDLGLYKEAQMNRRIRTLYEKRGYASYDDYFKAIKKDPECLNEFLERMTINVTEFFRNPVRWNVIKNKWLDEVKETKDVIKCWSAACSSGEEAYTLAMILMERFHTKDIELLATDIDEAVLKKAEEGIYTELSLKNIPLSYKRRYFQKIDDGLYQVTEELKKCVRFKQHNLLNDVFEKDFDLIVCRNVMIYFTEEAKEVLYEKFNQSLSIGGVLFVGSTEQIFHPQSYNFSVYDPFIYIKS